MPQIELPIGTTYQEAKQKAGELLATVESISSVRLRVGINATRMLIEYTEFSPAAIKEIKRCSK